MTESPCNIDLCSFNVNGLRVQEKRRAIFKKLKEESYNIVFLQETHCTAEVEKIWRAEWGGELMCSNGSSASKGVAILFKRGFPYKCLNKVIDIQGRYIIAHIEIEETEYLLCNLYAPTQNYEPEQMAVLDEISEKLGEFEIDNLIVGGDFNEVSDPELDRRRAKQMVTGNTKYREQIQGLKEIFSLVDIWRIRHPNLRRYSFHRREQASRIDYWLISEQLSNIVSRLDILAGTLSDHSKVTLSISNLNERRGPGLWKFNNTLLTDKDYVQKVKTQFGLWMTEYCDLEPDKKWEIIKYEIRKLSLRFSKRLKAESRKIQTQLEKDLQNLTAAHDSGQEVHDELNSVKRELGEIELTKARATIFRSRANWSQVGERPTKYFLNLEKRNYVNKQISQLEDEGGHLVSTQKQILNVQKRYYENLYSQNEGELDTIDDSCQFTETENLPTLSENQRTLIDRPLTKQDFLNSLKLLKNAKCPGSDGLTAEFYKFFWTDIGDCVTESLLYSTEVGYLSTEQKRGVISLIPKKGKNRLLLGNWRPISLLNTDYKIYTKTLAERIKPHLPNIINKDQNGFVGSRYIGTNIRTVEDVISFCSMRDCQAWSWQ